MRICKNCQKIIPGRIKIDGKNRILSSRLFCLDCRPFNCKNSSKFVNGARPSEIDNISSEDFKNLIKNSKSRAEVLDKLKMRKSGASFKIINRRIKNDELDISHFITGGHSGNSKRICNEELFTYLDRDRSSVIRNRIIKDKILQYKCQKCGVEDKWLNEIIILELDHIDGDRFNNKLENLRFLCPNCHSQTETFCGKRKKVKQLRKCSCGNIINKFYKKDNCAACQAKINESLIKPSLEQLKLDIYTLDAEKLKKKYHVRISKIKNWCLEYNIEYPHKNYWRMRRAGLTHEDSLNYKKRVRKPMNLFTQEQILEIKKLLEDGELSLRQIGKIFGRKHQIIMDIRDGKTYKDFNGSVIQTG